MSRIQRLFAALAALGLLFISVLAAAGCNTMEGIGKDMSAAGDGLSDAADGDE